MARICVTGAAGFIGSHLVKRLKDQGHWVRAVDIRQRPDRLDLYEHADEFKQLDLRDSEGCDRALKGVEWVYHLAADHGGAGFFHSHHDYPAAKNNAWVDMNVLEACEVQGVERLFYASSFCAYPTELQGTAYHALSGEPHPLSEDELTNGTPEQLYGGVKRQTTLFCEKAPFDARSGIFATIFGPYQEADGIRAKFPTAITKRVLESEPKDLIELWGDGSQIRTFLYIDDALERIQAIMEKPYNGPVNVASDEAVEVIDCATWVCEYAGHPPAFRCRDDMPTGVSARVPDNNKFVDTYGPPSQIKAQEGFRRLYEWMKERSLVAA